MCKVTPLRLSLALFLASRPLFCTFSVIELDYFHKHTQRERNRYTETQRDPQKKRRIRERKRKEGLFESVAVHNNPDSPLPAWQTLNTRRGEQTIGAYTHTQVGRKCKGHSLLLSTVWVCVCPLACV